MRLMRIRVQDVQGSVQANVQGTKLQVYDSIRRAGCAGSTYITRVGTARCIHTARISRVYKRTSCTSCTSLFYQRLCDRYAAHHPARVHSSLHMDVFARARIQFFPFGSKEKVVESLSP
jgi:hypothetical protein